MRLFRRRGGAHAEAEALIAAAKEFLDAPTWEASLEVVERNPILLGDTADELLGKSIEAAQADPEDVARSLELHRTVLRRVRTAGVGAARVDLGLSVAPGDPDAELMQRHEAGRASLNEYWRARDATSLNDGIETLRAVVRRSQQLGRESTTYHASLGWALMSRATARGNGGDMDAACQCFERARQLAAEAPEERINATFGLAATLQSRGEPGDLERSVALCESELANVAAGTYEAEALAAGLSTALMKLHWRTRDQRVLDRAVGVVDEAANHPSSESSPNPAKVMLPSVLMCRYDELGRRNDLLRALRLYEELLPLYGASSPERLWLAVDLMLALNKISRLTDDKRYLDRAIVLGEELLPEAPPGAARRLLQMRLGVVLTNRFCGTDAERLAKAARLLEEGIGDASSADVESLVMLASTHLNRYWLTDDIADLVRGHTAVVRGLTALRSSFGRVAPLEGLFRDRRCWSVYSLATRCMLMRASVDAKAAPFMRRDAMVTTEMGKARLLTEQLGRGELPPPAMVPAATASRERELVDELVVHDTAELAALQAERGTPQTTPEHAARMRRELHALWAEVERLGDEAREWVELRRGDPLTWDDLKRLATPGSALVSLAEIALGLVAFVLPDGAEEPVVVETDLDERRLTDAVMRLRREVAPSGRAHGDTWHRSLAPLLREVANHIEGARQVVLATQALTYLIPWAVVADEAGWRAPDGGPMPLVTVPALSVLPPLRRRPAHDAGRIVVVGDPKGDLPFARREAEAVAGQCRVDGLIGSRATSERVLTGLGTAGVVHLATHADFDRQSPLDSGIVLADRVVRAREILASSMRAELVVLSACETGLADSLGGNELAGLALAFLHAGARAVVMSLWRVDDEATSAFMTTFYGELAAGADGASALARGAARVRTEPRWHQPAFWGAFVLLGDAPAGQFRGLGAT